ncbi:Phosphatidylinositol 4-phosphate 3-kinase C2 domain-containing subunit alpha [Schistosoma japonicum]|uniref:Phosphatidylinositol 4-phosphate 3-kinase C2 domain-containing subunit alpha n=1 Tax=Schistosoma japonicum TaxID=6182 RepID=A0A4Z2DER5_SCHJA|nr:Phosphatidylinositol 4-phosphate 3-kinase C2 domain-containing subunit alpha [Schistosoma japonicum]
MSNSQNETTKLKDLIDFECDVDSSTHKFSEIQLLFDPLIKTSVNSNICSHNNLISLSSFVEPLNTLSECTTKNDFPFDLIPNYSTGSSIKPKTVKSIQSVLSYAPKDAYNVIKRNKSDLSSETFHSPLVDINGNACLSEQTANTSTENVESKEHQQDLPIFFHTLSPLCLRRSDRNITNTITTSQNQRSSTVPLIHFIGNSQPTDELKLFVNYVQSLRRKKYNKTKTSTLINDLDRDAEQNSSNSETVYSPPDAWAYDCVYNNNFVTNTTLKAPQTGINNLLSSTFNSSVHQDSNPVWKTETAASNVSYVYPKSKDYSVCQENSPTHSVNSPRWCIPQLEVRITAHLNGRRKSSQSLTTSNNLNINSEITNNNPVNPRLRLVCDPTTTLVNELMLEALANDLIPPEVILDVNEYQLRLQGRAELLRPDAYLCDCYQVQLCHRLDQPLKLILEPKDVDRPYFKNTLSDDNEQFNPQSYFTNNRPTPTEEDTFISYSVFQNALEKLRSCIVENYAQVDSESWLKEVHCSCSSLCQSVKAVLAAVCYGIAFSDVINALGNVQVCIMDIVCDIGLNHKVSAGSKRHDNNNFNSLRNDSQLNTTQDNWLSSYRRKQTKTSPTTGYNLPSIHKNVNKTLVNLKRDIKLQSRKKLNNLLLSLNKNLLCQLNAFFIWRQMNLSVNPELMQNNLLSNDGVNESLAYLNNKEFYHTNGRPKAILITDDNFLDDNQQSEQKRQVKSSADCFDAIVVGLIAIHNPPPRKTVGAYSSNVISNNSTVNSSLSGSLSSSQPNSVNNNSSSTRADGYYCVRLGLVYAGRPLGKVYPSELTTYHDDIACNRYVSSSYKNQLKDSSWSSNYSSRDKQKYFKDYFISDPGRYQTIQSGFPKVLQFDQWFKFTSFTINQLPRETMLAISFFSCKKLNSDNSEVDGTLIGWANFPLFDINGRLKQNTMVVGLWPPSEFMHEYRPTWSQSNTSPGCPVVQLCFPEYQYEIEFPIIIQSESELENSSQISVSSFNSLCSNAKQSIIEAKSAILMQILNPELSFKSIDACLMAYSAASSSMHLSRQREQITIPVLQLAVLNSVNSSFNQYNLNVTGGNSSSSNSGSGLGNISTSGYGGHSGNNSNCSNHNNISNNSNINNNLNACYSIHSVACYLPFPPVISIEVLWNLRYYICDVPDAMIAFVTSCLISWPQTIRENLKNDTDPWCWEKLLKEIYSLLAITPVPYPGLILRLLSSNVADQGIRHWATRALSLLSSDSLLLYLPQIIEAINHDLYLDYSGLVSLILHRAAFSMRFANSVYWYLYPMLHHLQPSSEWKVQRFRFIQAAVYWNADCRLRTMWKRQEEMINQLSETATKVKQARTNASVREDILYSHLKQFMSYLSQDYHRLSTSSLPHKVSTNENSSTSCIHDKLTSDSESLRKKPTDNVFNEHHLSQYDLGLRMPYNPGLLTHRLDIAVGDDLRLDSLICQLTFLMDRIWLDAGLDLRMIHFRILPTEDQKGFIELVSECSTLRQIQQQGGGLTGPFKEGVITKWLQSQNITELDYKRALDNFLRSLAGCCVATYILGVGDRHNDNIMIRYSGHVFHVDFSKVFGNSQTFAGIKRDRVPFVLTQDMLHVLNTYSKDVTTSPNGLIQSSGFGYTPGHGSSHSQQGVQIFIDRCCEAYNLIRHRSYQLITLLELSLSMNIPGLNRDSIRFVLRALRLELNDQEASQYFTELVRKTLHSKSSSFNFFVHGLAQVKQASLGGGVSGTNTNLSDNSSPSRLNNQIDGHWNASSNSYINISNKSNNNSPNISGKLVHDLKPRSPPSKRNLQSNFTGTGQIFSFNPKRFTNSSDGNIDAIVVEVAVKKKTDDKHSDYYFPMNVWRENCRVPTRVYRRTSDLEELESRLQEHFPNSVVTKTVSHIMNALNSISVSSTRSQDHVQSLIDSVLSDDVISKSTIVYTFFHSVLFDERFTAEDMSTQGLNTPASSSSVSKYWPPLSSSSSFQDYLPEKSKECTTHLLIPSLSSPSSPPFHLFHNNSTDNLTSTYNLDCLPAVQIQLYLSENSRRLDVLIKHARCLFIPGSNEPPDVYIKVYLLSGRRRKTTKRKTNIVRRSSSPSFNVTFTYDLIPNDIQCGFVEVSAWHAVHIGENIPFGQIYIQLKSIRPGHVYTHWYILCSDPACLS